MKSCGTLINNLLTQYASKKNNLQKILPDILGYYWQYVSEMTDKNDGILCIGISFPQCLPHLATYKNFFLAELAQRGENIKNIIFFFKTKIKNKSQFEYIKKIKKTAKDKSEMKLSSIEEAYVKKKISQLHHNSEYSDLLLQLYCVAKKNNMG